MLTFEFSDTEYSNRKIQTLALAAELGCDSVIAFGENRSGVAVTYLTGWSVTRAAVCAIDRNDTHLWIQFPNHVPYARRILRDCAIHELHGDWIQDLFSGRSSRVATLGPVDPRVRKHADTNGIALIPMDKEHAGLRMIKSNEEIAALQLGGSVSDIAAQALIDACVPGTRDWDLLAAAKDAYTRAGGRDYICYICVTDMHNPDRDVPSQFPEGRVLSKGSVVTFELSAAIAPEYPGQILRTVSLGEPIDPYPFLIAVAELVKADIKSAIAPGVNTQELILISQTIENSGFTTTDDLFHGFGMGYLEPVGTSSSRTPRHSPNMDLSAGMALVIQPNVTLIDHSAGVQTGELVVVTSTGIADMHTLPTGLITV